MGSVLVVTVAVVVAGVVEGVVGTGVVVLRLEGRRVVPGGRRVMKGEVVWGRA